MQAMESERFERERVSTVKENSQIEKKGKALVKSDSQVESDLQSDAA